jgi:hypothetical protein
MSNWGRPWPCTSIEHRGTIRGPERPPIHVHWPSHRTGSPLPLLTILKYLWPLGRLTYPPRLYGDVSWLTATNLFFMYLDVKIAFLAVLVHLGIPASWLSNSPLQSLTGTLMKLLTIVY